MTTPINAGELQVNPLTVINILKARLAEEQSRSALLEAALQESHAREAELTSKEATVKVIEGKPVD